MIAQALALADQADKLATGNPKDALAGATQILHSAGDLVVGLAGASTGRHGAAR